MAVTLDAPMFCQGLAIAAIARFSFWPLAFPGSLSIAGRKDPVAVLLHDGTVVRGFCVTGRTLSLAEIEALLPGAADTLANAWRENHGAGDRM